MRRGITRRQFIGSSLAAGAASGCGTTNARMPRALALPPRSEAELARVREVLKSTQATLNAPEPAAFGTDVAAVTMMRIDVHCHTFNARDVPIDGFIRSLAQGYGVPAMFDGLLAEVTRPFHRALVKATPADAPADSPAHVACDLALPLPSKALEDALAALGKWLARTKHSDLAKIEAKLAAFLKSLQTVTVPREVVAARIACTYPQVELFTPALVDFGYWINHDNKKVDVLDAEVGIPEQLVAHAAVSR
ncbi:MAG: hypothetical protein JWM82_4399, partial [Myxococcales bacterium]|nr:hypothetical protein [Myxococcales bacterium]